jgi:hypothetical protein
LGGWIDRCWRNYLFGWTACPLAAELGALDIARAYRVGQSRRISKKRHREFLIDVLAAISLSYVWRARLYEAGIGHEFLLTAETLDDVPPETRALVRRYNLKYRGAWVPHAWTHGWEDTPGMIMFRVQAVAFPELVEFSANNPAAIYGQPLAGHS